MAAFRRTRSHTEAEAVQPGTRPNPPLSSSSRTSSWTALSRKSSDPPTPPSPDSTPVSSASGTTFDTVTTPQTPGRTFTNLATRLFRPSSSSGASSRPSTASSIKPSEMSTSSSAIDRTRSTQSTSQLSRTNSIASTSSPDSATTPGAVSPPPGPSHRTSWTSVLGFGSDRGRSSQGKQSSSSKSRPSSEIFSSTPLGVPNPGGFGHTSGLVSGVGGMKAPAMKADGSRPSSMPLAPSPQMAAALRSIGQLPGGSDVPTIREGVPLTPATTIDSVSASLAGEDRRGRNRARSSSPFRIWRSSRSRNKDNQSKRGRSPSPAIHALKCDAESDGETVGGKSRDKRGGTKVRRSAFFSVKTDDDDDDDQTEGEETEEDSSWSDEDDDGDDEDGDDGFDPLTTQNTQNNAASPLTTTEPLSPLGFPGWEDEVELPNPLGEGVNVVRPEEPLFARTEYAPRTSTSSLTPAEVAARTPKRKKTLRGMTHWIGDPLTLVTSRPHFARDRCTVVIRHGHPERYCGEDESPDVSEEPEPIDGTVTEDGVKVTEMPRRRREPKRYVIFSDLSEESRWAVEWGIGTVLRDGDEMILVTVQETDGTKLDPVEGANVDRMQKLRNQQERQALSALLVRQATSLLQRTKLNVTVTCQALHAKNARRLFLDIIDFIEPTMVIVGSRGLGKLKGILLGSTSHYLIQRSSVPVMVARRRLKRPTKKSHSAAEAISMRAAQHVSLADARIEKESSGKGKGAAGVAPDDIVAEHEKAENQWPDIPGEEDEEGEHDNQPEEVKAISPTSPTAA